MAAGYTPEQVRTFVRTTYGLVDVSDQILDMALVKSPLAGVQPFFDIFGYIIAAEEMYGNLNQKKYSDVILMPEKSVFKSIIKGTFLGDILLEAVVKNAKMSYNQSHSPQGLL
jgi:hypothetical protein